MQWRRNPFGGMFPQGHLHAGHEDGRRRHHRVVEPTTGKPGYSWGVRRTEDTSCSQMADEPGNQAGGERCTNPCAFPVSFLPLWSVLVLVGYSIYRNILGKNRF